MPKQQLSLNKFEGGISDVYDPRDIAANALSDITNAIVSTIGKIKVISQSRAMDEHNIYNTLCSSARGYGLYPFMSDYEVGEEGLITAAARYTAGGADAFSITSANHGIAIGDRIWIMGIGSSATANINYDGYHSVIKTTENTIIVDKVVSAASITIYGHEKYVKIDSYRMSKTPDVAMGNNAKVGIFQSPAFLTDVIEIYSSVLRTDGSRGANLNGQTAFTNYKVEHSFYWSNGALRVSDGNFNNIGTNVNKVYEYLSAKTYFSFGIGQFLLASGGLTSGFSNAGGYEGDAQASDEVEETVDQNGFDAVNGAGNGYHIVRSNSVDNDSFDQFQGHTCNVSFDLELRATIDGNLYEYTGLASYDPNGDPEAIGSWPMCYFIDKGSVPMPPESNIFTQMELAKPGHNNFTFKGSSGAANPTNPRFCFAVTCKSAYNVRNFTIREYGPGADSSPIDDLSGRKAGWYDSIQEIYAPTIHLNAGSERDERYIEGCIAESFAHYDQVTTVSGDSGAPPDCLVMAMQSNESITNSDWLFGGNSPNDHTFLSFAHSWVYEGDQESLLFNYTGINKRDTTNALPEFIPGDNAETRIDPTKRYIDMSGITDGLGLDFKLKFKIGTPRHNRRIGSRLYLTGFGPSLMETANIYGSIPTKHAPLIDDPLLFADINFETGVTLFDGTEGMWTPEDDVHGNRWSEVEFTGISKFPALTYKLLNLYSHKQKSLYARHKTATIVNNRVYIGGIKQDTDGSGNMRVYSDRIIKSPVGKHDIFPSDNRMDIAFNDGEDIVILHNFNDRILQFKENNLYIINVAGEYEFIESKLKGMGVLHPAHTIETDFGIAFFNSSGCYIYDGEKVASLTAQKIDVAKWSNDFPGDLGVIGYSPTDKYIICSYLYKQWLYNLTTQSWVKSDALGLNTHDLTNSINLLATNGMVVADNTRSDDTDGAMVVAHTTPEAMGLKATGSIRWDSIDTSSGVGYGKARDSGGVQRNVSGQIGTNIVLGAWDPNSSESSGYELVCGFLAYDFTGYITTTNTAADNGGYTRPGIRAVPVSASEIESSGRPGVFLTADSYGTAMNASASYQGNLGIYASTDADFGTTGGTFEALSGGVNPVKGVTTITISRDDDVEGDIFTLYIKPLTTSAGANFMFQTPLSYTTLDEDTASDVAAALHAKIMSEPAYFAFLDAEVSGAVITISARPLDDTSALTEVSSGYATFQNEHLYTRVQKSSEIDLKEFKPSIHTDVPAGTAQYNVVTKDIDFGAPGVRKKVYKIYVTYKCNSESYVKANFYVNGARINSSNAKTFTAGASYNYTSSTFDNSSNEWKVAELKPSTSSDANNIYSIALQLTNNGSHVTPADFEINDVTFIYRTKNIK